MDIIILLGMVLGIMAIAMGTKKHDKRFKYVGTALIILCSIYIVPQFIGGFIDGWVSAALIP